MKIFLFLFVNLLAQVSYALPTRDFWVPQARSTSKGRYKFDMNTYMSPSKGSGNGSYGRSEVGVNYGVFESASGALEAGLDWAEPSTEETIAALRMHLRAVALNLEEHGFAIALGVDQLGFRTGVSDPNIVYLLFQNYLSDNWEMSVGGYVGNASLLVDENGGAQNRGVMGGIWSFLDGRKAKFGFEVMTGRSFSSYIVAGFKTELKPQVTGSLSYALANNRYFRDWLVVRLTLDF